MSQLLNAQHASQIEIGIYKMELALVMMASILTKLPRTVYNVFRLDARNVKVLMHVQNVITFLIGFSMEPLDNASAWMILSNKIIHVLIAQMGARFAMQMISHALNVKQTGS